MANLKANEDQIRSIEQWLTSKLGVKNDGPSFCEWLKNGVILCRLANKIRPGSVRKTQTVANVNSSDQLPPFKCMENVDAFLRACQLELSVPIIDLFTTVDLVEAKVISKTHTHQ